MVRNGFTKKRVGTMTLGEKLKFLREERRMSIAEASRGTKIQAKYLEFLENGSYDLLPADVYVRGFLRSYGEVLGIDEKVIMKLYAREKGIKDSLAKSKNQDKRSGFSKPVNISSFVFTPKKIAVTLFGVLLFAAVAYLYNEVGSFSNDPRLLIFNPQNNSQINGNSVVIDGITDKDAKLFVNDQPILVDDEGRFREELTLQSGVNTISVRARNKFDKEKTEVVSVQANYEDKANQGDGSQGADGSEGSNDQSASSGSDAVPDKLQLEVRVDPGPVWLNVEADDNLVFSGTMLAGAVQSFTADNKFVVNSGRGNATFVKFNGKDIGTLGQDPGAVRGVTLTRDTKVSN